VDSESIQYILQKYRSTAFLLPDVKDRIGSGAGAEYDALKYDPNSKSKIRPK
jgi:hypothetical protein